MSKVKECVRCKVEFCDENKIFIVNHEDINIYQCPYCGAYQVKEEVG